MKYQIAIVDANTLTALALKSILQDLVPFAQISTYSSPKELLKEETALIVHAFVSAKIFATSQELKSALGKRIIVVGEAETPASLYQGYHFLNVEESEMDIVKNLLKLRNMGHPTGNFAEVKSSQICQAERGPLLSKREEEVCKGNAIPTKKNAEKRVSDVCRIH